jgi:predicted DNA-binding antitoxin AbrB/MazE fold protein
MKAISELIDGKTTQLNQQQTNSIERNKFIETIYPNPVLDNIIVKFKQGINLKDGENITIDLLDITGKLLITMNEKLYQNNSSIKVDCKNYSSGIYTLVFQFNNNIEYEKISIIK